ncbi:MAG: HPr kinase/phosphorylase [Hyphomicrobiaceae bacterium]
MDVAPPDPGRSRLLHATAIAVDGHAAVLLGPSGAGKSDLALRCLMLGALDGDRPLRARLVADDQVHVDSVGGALTCRPPPTIAGRIEVRGLGIMTVPHIERARVALVVQLTSGPIERLPEPVTFDILGHAIPALRLTPFEASAPFKLLLALARAI